MSFTKFVSVAALAAVAAAQNTTYVVTQTSVETITSCAETVTDCPALNHNGTAYITHTNTVTVTSCPPESTGPEPVPASSAPAKESTAKESSAPTTAAKESSAKESPKASSASGTAPSTGEKPAATTSAPAAPTAAPSDEETTYVTVEQGVTVTVVGTKSHNSTGVAEVPTSNAPVQANGAAGMSLGGAAALVAGALLL